MPRFERTGWFSLELPEGWVSESGEAEEPIVFYHPDGAGTLELSIQDLPRAPAGERIDPVLFLHSFLHRSGVRADTESIRQFSVDGAQGAFCTFTSPGPEGPLSECAWLLTNGGFVVFLSYTCREGEGAGEQEVVSGVVSSLRLQRVR